MPLNPKPQAHGKRKIQAGVSTGSSVSSLNLDGNTLQLNQTNSQPQRTVDLSSLTSGDIKVKTQYHMFEKMCSTEKPLYLNFDEALKTSREILKI